MTGKLKAAMRRSKAVKELNHERLIYEVSPRYASFKQFTGRSYLMWGEDLENLFIDEINRYGQERRDDLLKRLDQEGKASRLARFELRPTLGKRAAKITRRRRRG